VSNTQASFAHLVKTYSQKNPGWRDADLLRTIGNVRNSIVHEKTEPYGYVAIPTPELAKKLQACRKRLMDPALVFPKFRRKVETVLVQDSLEQVLRIIKERDYSQFPVLEVSRFRGLLTENGITRWLAHHVTTQISLVELNEVTVGEVIGNEEMRENYKFIARSTRVDDLVDQFASHKLLEAIMITANGKESEALLGIATRWDIIHLA
jgi:predicted transcriptional regulator